MRKIIVCEKITPDIEEQASALGIGEIVQGLPAIYGDLKDLALPAVIVESSNGPQNILLAKTLGQVSKIQLASLLDLPAAITKSLEERITLLENTVKAQVPQ